MFPYLYYTAVFITPKIIGSSGSKIHTTITDSVSSYCSFNAAIMEGATIVMWLKDQLAINGYDTSSVKGEDNQLRSILQIKTVNHEALGIYTCYCYYNDSIVTFDKPIKSDKASIYLCVDKDCSAEESPG